MDSQKVALFIVPGSSIDTPSDVGLISHKFDHLYDTFVRAGWDTRIVVDVYTRKPRVKTKYKTSSVKLRFLLWVMLIAIRNPGRLFRSTRPLSFLNQEALEGLYRELIQTSNSHAVLAIGSSEALVRACKSVGIPCVEIQHGILNQEVIQRYWPGGQCPTMLLSWDPHTSQIAEEMGILPWTVGHADANVGPTKAPFQPTLGAFICVSLSHSAQPSEDPWGCFPQGLADSVDLLIERKVPFFIRLHPHWAERAFQAKLLTRWIHRRFGVVRVDNPRQISLRESIADSFLHLTNESAAWFEFALSGRPTVMLNKSMAKEFGVQALKIGIWPSSAPPILGLKSHNWLLEYINSIDGLQQVGLTQEQSLEDFMRYLEQTSSNQ